MLNLLSNPVFVPLLLISIGSGLWWILSPVTTSEKKKQLNLIVDNVFYFLFIAFILNGLAHISEIIELPYRALILSTNAVSLSFILVLTYRAIRYLIQERENHETLVSVFQLISLIGLVNHIYYYYLYKSTLTVGLIVLFSGLLLFFSIVPLKGNRWMYVSLLGLVLHLILTRKQAILYFGFIVTPELIALTAIEWSLLLVLLLRRQKQSERT